MRVVVDPGVFISAALSPEGVPQKVLAWIRSQGIELVLSPQLVVELEDAITRSKFRGYLSTEEARRFVDSVLRVGTMRSEPPFEPGLTRDPKDDYLIALARAAEADYLVSGDRDLLEADAGGVAVVTPRQMLESLP